MKEEFYHYVFPRNRITNSNKSERISKQNDRCLYAFSFVLLLVASLPMALSKTWLWGIFLVLYVSGLFFNKKDKDPYSQTMFFFGISIAYFSISVAYASILRHPKIQSTWLILIIIGILFYEIGVFINILLKKYSDRNKKQYIAPASISIFGILVGSQLGRWTVQRYTNKPWLMYVMIAVGALIFTLAFSFLQKYVLYKILKNKNLNNEM